jgi:hypothetical protein
MNIRFFAYFEIDGYPFSLDMNEYEPWLFVPDDRIIRPLSHERRARYCTRSGWSDDFSTRGQGISEYVYVTDAQTLRQRLETAGYDETSLHLEYLRCCQETRISMPDRTLTREEREKRYWATEYQLAFHHANLNDWLNALKEVMSKDLTRQNRRKRTQVSASPNEYYDADLLIDMVTDFTIVDYDSMRGKHHNMGAFPCRSRECMALAMLSVVPADAECVLDVSELVSTEFTDSFDDLIAEKESAILLHK